MLRVFAYHWLPMADNMLLESSNFVEGSIEQGIRDSKHVNSASVNIDIDAISYEILFPLDSLERNSVNLKIQGRINLRGFCQHTLIVNSPPDSVANWLNKIVPQYCDFLRDFLIDIVPYTVKNNAAVLYERMADFKRFNSNPFETSIDNAAQEYFSEQKFVIISVNKIIAQTLEGTALTALGIGLNESIVLDKDILPLISTDRKILLFISDSFVKEEQTIHDGIYYKFGAVVTFTQTTLLVIDILRETRSHVPPLRRELAIALQPSSAIEEDFTPFTRISRYLGYVNIKLPVIKTVRGYLTRVYGSDEFKAKIDTFSSVHKYQSFPSLSAISLYTLQPVNLVKRLDDAYKRLDEFLSEEKEELGIVSDEIERHLNIALASERARISARELEATETNRELNRGGKNRANALKGLSIVLAGGLGLSIASEIETVLLDYTNVPVLFSTALSLGFMAAVIAGAWYFINWTIRSQSGHFRMVMEIKNKIPPTKLKAFTAPQKLKRSEINRGRRIQAWDQQINCYLKPKKNYISRLLRQQHKFNVTLDYETSGFVHLISVECEYQDVSFDERCIVTTIFEQMQQAGCFAHLSKKHTSLYADVLMQLDLPIEDSLPSLNYILTLQEQEFRSRLEGYITVVKTDGDYRRLAMTDAEISNLEHIINNRSGYQNWLGNWIGKESDSMVGLLGAENINSKWRIVEEMKAYDE